MTVTFVQTTFANKCDEYEHVIEKFEKKFAMKSITYDKECYQCQFCSNSDNSNVYFWCDVAKRNYNNGFFIFDYYKQRICLTHIKSRYGMEGVYSAYYKSLSGDVKERYEEKIRRCGCDPYAIKKKELSVNPCDFPEITILDIGEYLVHSVSSFTKKKFSAYKSTEAYKHFESGFVLNIGSKKYKEFAILRGRVKHGQKMNEKSLDVWVLANMNGKIECSHCTCLAGLGETCSHVGAICYAISNLWDSSETKSVTDFLCKWNVPNFKENSMTFASNIQWKPNSLEKSSLESSFVEYCNSLTPFSDESIETFIKECNSDGNRCALASILFPEERRNTSIKDEVFLSSLYSDTNKGKTRRELVDIGKSISIELSTDEVNEISRLTVSRSKSICRFGLKRGRIIASNFKDCCSAIITDPSISFINRMMNPMNNFGSYPKYVTKKKKRALEGYARRQDLHHQEFERYECGLIINPKFPYFAASPDGLVVCDCHGEGCVVIKFFKIMESAESFEVLTREPNRILNRNEIEGDYYLDRTQDLYYEIQLQINVVELKYCDLILWSPNPNLDHLIIRIYADVDFWKRNMEKAQTFHDQVMMPEILGKSFTRIRTDSSNGDDENIAGDEIESGEDSDVFARESSASIQCQGNKEKENAYSITNLFIESRAISEKNLMNDSTEEILKTFFDHEDQLKRLYDEQMILFKRNYRQKDLPFMIAYDILNDQQLQAMANFAETRLAHNLEHHNSSDVIFDAILPEWALAAFCRKFNFTRAEALETLKIQSQAAIDMNTSDCDLRFE